MGGPWTPVETCRGAEYPEARLSIWYGLSTMGQASQMFGRFSNPRKFGIYSADDMFSMGCNSPKAVINYLTLIYKMYVYIQYTDRSVVYLWH